MSSKIGTSIVRPSANQSNPSTISLAASPSASLPKVDHYNNAELSARVAGFLDPTTVNVQALQQKLKTDLDRVAAKAPKPPEAVFWGLGKRFWMQIFDGKYHSFGHLVFDLGLHKGAVEAGFYESIKAACLWIGNKVNISKKVNTAYYKTVHKIACQHFKGKENETLISSEMTGKFQTSLFKSCGGEGCALFPLEFPTAKDIARFEKERKMHQENITKGWNVLYSAKLTEYISEPKVEGQLTKIEAHIQQLKSKDPESEDAKTLENFLKAQAWESIWKEKIAAQIAKVNAEITERSEALGFKPIAEVSGGLNGVRLLYTCPNNKLEEVADAIFKQYHEKMSKAKTEEEKNRVIAELYQLLEWLHGFRDGQGRTDLLILAKELALHGLTPAILDEPYASSFSTLDDWSEYLARGRKKWREETSEERKLDLVIEELAEKLRVIQVPPLKNCRIYEVDDGMEKRAQVNPDTKKLEIFLDRLSREDFIKGYIDIYVQTKLDDKNISQAFRQHENEGWRWERLYILTNVPFKLRLKMKGVLERANVLKEERAAALAVKDEAVGGG